MDFIQKLENLTIKNDSYDRDLTNDEISKIEQWKREINQQDRELEDAHDVIVNVKKEIKKIGVNIEATNKRIKLIDNHASKTESNIKKTSNDLRNILNKIRSSDKFCIDLILIFIFMGLTTVLYNMIKSKMETHEATK
jgi:septal ring factor EnvC (AmiA/AmiB activator)